MKKGDTIRPIKKYPLFLVVVDYFRAKFGDDGKKLKCVDTLREARELASNDNNIEIHAEGKYARSYDVQTSVLVKKAPTVQSTRRKGQLRFRSKPVPRKKKLR